MGIIKTTQLNITDAPSETYHAARRTDVLQKTVIHFQYIDGFAANQTDVAIYKVGANNFSDEYMPRAGQVATVIIRSSSAVTAGTLTATVTKNGTKMTGILAQLNNTTKTLVDSQDYTTSNTYSAADKIGIVFTSSSDFAPTTSDLEATVICI